MNYILFLLIWSCVMLMCNCVVSSQQQSILVRETSNAETALPECPVCVEFMSEFINELLNIIANSGVIGGT